VPTTVDMGLSVMWANRNLGATEILERGNCYAFAEVAPKEVYDWSIYRYCDNAFLLTQHDLGVDCICGTEYDAAHVTLGNGWRLPTLEESRELVENTMQELQEKDGVKYLLLTGKNGGTISICLFWAWPRRVCPLT